MHQVFHDEMRARTAVVDIADQVQMVHSQADDHAGKSHDAAFCLSGRDDRFEDAFIIAGLVRNIVVCHELFDQIAEFLGNRLADLGTGIFDRNAPGHADEAQQLHAVPFVHIRAGFFNKRHFFLGIINQSRQFGLIFTAQLEAEFQIDLAANASGAVFQDMGKLLVFAVHVTDEVLGALRQVQNGSQIDDFCRGFGNARILIGKRFQIAQIIFIHFFPPNLDDFILP